MHMKERQRPEQKLLLDGVAWLGNVSSSVFIIFVNKILMSTTGYAFRYGEPLGAIAPGVLPWLGTEALGPSMRSRDSSCYVNSVLVVSAATTLCAFHYLVCSLSIWVTQSLGGVKRVALPMQDLLLFTATANLSIVSLNLSLMLNPVGFYQIAKLLIIPFVCVVEKVWLGRVFTRGVIAAVMVVITGVAIVTVTDTHVSSNTGGLLVAGMSVVSSGMQQILCRTMQQKHKLSSHELLSNTAPAQGWTLLLLGPFIDRLVSGLWVFNYEVNVPALTILSISCGCAVFVNVSQFMCLGRFSAVSFQVLGHSKTILVLVGGWAFLGDTVSQRQLAGMALAVAGMVAYGVESSKAPPKLSNKLAPDKEDLLNATSLSDSPADPLNPQPRSQTKSPSRDFNGRRSPV
eukprot:jgi/Astpho2/6769/Aster-07215